MDQGDADGIEWEDDMVEVNRATTAVTMHWKFLDRTSGADSPTIDWHFTVGERVKLRLVNEMDSDHPMHVTDPGLWMAHCHIAEHMQSGMMFSFDVAREGADL